MRRRKHINHEPLVMGGQAQIRDTGIMVSEIVRLALDGASQAEILKQFPQLDAEDVHDALTYSFDMVSSSFNGWQSRTIQAVSEISKLANKLRKYSQDVHNIGLHIGKIAWAIRLAFGVDSETLALFASRAHLHSSVMHTTSSIATVEYITRSAKNFMISHGVVPRVIIDNEESKQLKTYNVSHPLSWICLSLTRTGSQLDPPRLESIYCAKEGTNIVFSIPVKIINVDYLRRHLVSDFLMVHHPSLLAIYHLWKLGSELIIRQEENSVIFEFVLPIMES